MTETDMHLLQPIPEVERFTLVTIPAGSFVIGDTEDKGPTITLQDFYMGQYPVTQQLWQHVMGHNPSYFKGNQRPVEQVSWDDICQKDGFLQRLNGREDVQAWLQQQQLAGWAFALPSEAQWEYAARGGAGGQKDGFEYPGSNDIDEVAWYEDNSHNETKPVGLKAPNQLGLYDMGGNVWEWCADDWVADYKGMSGDGRPRIQKPERARDRALRGGSFFYQQLYCRSAFRLYGWPDYRNRGLGFRLVLCPVQVAFETSPQPLSKRRGSAKN